MPGLAPPRLLHETDMTGVEWLSDEFSVANEGIRIERKTIAIDLSQEISVSPEQRDTSKISPSIHNYEILAMRINDNAHYLVYEIASQRRQMDISCVSSHPHSIWFRKDATPLGRSFRNVWTVVIDLRQHARDIPFTVKFRVTKWNAYQGKIRNFVGHLVSANEQEIVTEVTLPKGRILKMKPLLKMKIQGDPNAKWVEYDGDAELSVNPDGTGFHWKFSPPKQHWSYIAEFDWSE